ncbi:hypothetical protein EDC01DRAFT_755140 [Geopyxis carbonaria]|nr:hypothetical protein EDC01DRAFT_755140 [Geopyxis carbonaria]
MSTLPSYPFLTAFEFSHIATLFLQHQSHLNALGYCRTPQWVLKHAAPPPYTRQPPTPYLELRRRLPPLSTPDPDQDQEDEEDEEDDPESLGGRARGGVEVVYNILYSSTYRLPVLYFVAPEGDVRDVLALGDGDGVVGQGEHGLSGEMWWFVHPCRTGEAMEGVRGAVVGEAGGEDMGEGDREGGEVGGRYLGLWLGFVGGVAGLQAGAGRREEEEREGREEADGVGE